MAGGALRNLLVRVGADISGLRKGMQDAQKEVAYFGRNVTGALGGIKSKIAGALAAVGGGITLGKGIDDAMKYEAIMSTLDTVLGSSMGTFMKWQDTVGQAMGFSRLQGAQLANQLSLNFRSIATSTADLTNKTTKMMETAAIISNKRGMTMEEVSDRIRSAMNMEADGADELGVNVRIAAVQASNAYKQMANGKPWAQLNTNQQKTILYQYILDSVTQNLGSTMADTTAKRMGAFTASLADVQLALGQAFLPILYDVLPLLTTLMNWLYTALEVFAAFSKALFGGFVGSQKAGAAQTKQQTQAIQGQTGAMNNLGKAATKTAAAHQKAAKAAKAGVAAFDEVNQLQANANANAAGAGGGAGGGGGVGGAKVPAVATPSFTPPTLGPDLGQWQKNMNDMAKNFNSIAKPIKAVAKAIADFFKEQFGNFLKWWKDNGQNITKGFQLMWAIIWPIIKLLAGFLWDSIQGVFKGIVDIIEGATKFITSLINGDWKGAFQGLWQFIWGIILLVWNAFNLTLFGGIKKLLLDFVKNGRGAIVQFFADMMKPLGPTIKEWLAEYNGLIKGIIAFFKNFGKWVADYSIQVALKFVLAWEKAKLIGQHLWDAFKGAWSSAIGWVGRMIVTPLINSFDNIKKGFSQGLGGGLRALVDEIRNPINNVVGVMNGVKNAMHIPIPNIPQIPYLAKGGIAYGPMMAMIGEKGPEAVVPLDRLQTLVSNAVLAATSATAGHNTSRVGVNDIVLNIDGRQFARIIRPHLDLENKRVGPNVRLNNI